MPVSKKAYVHQISIYLKAGDYEKALETSREFTRAYPHSFIAHFLCATSLFNMRDYEPAVEEGKKAYFISEGTDDMVYAALVAGSSLFMLGRIEEGRDFISAIGDKKSLELEKLRFAFAAASGDAAGTKEHYRELVVLNHNAAGEMIKRVLG